MQKTFLCKQWTSRTFENSSFDSFQKWCRAVQWIHVLLRALRKHAQEQNKELHPQISKQFNINSSLYILEVVISVTNKLSFCSVVRLRLYGNIYMYIWNQWQSGIEYNILILPVTSKHLVGNGELGSLFQFSYSDGTSCTRKVGYLNFPPSSFVLLS